MRYSSAMDEMEQRTATYELALIEVVAHVDRREITEGIKAIRAGLVVRITPAPQRAAERYDSRA